MPSPTPHVGPVAPASPELVGAMRDRNQALEAAIRHAIPALGAVADDPCKPAQRELLNDVIADLRGVVS